MHKGLVLVALAGMATAAAPALARDIHIDAKCSVESDYDFGLSEQSVIFTRDSPAPRQVVMRQGRLFVDGAWVTLSPADRDRIAQYERDARATMPLAQQVGRDAADLAFTVIGEVAGGFSSDPASTKATLAKAKAKLDTKLARSMTSRHYSADDVGDSIGEAVRDVMPSVMGDVVGGAVRAALSGDHSRLDRMENLDKEIDAKIEQRADAINVTARALCKRMQALDELDNALEYRTAAGKPLELLQARAPDEEDKDGTDGKDSKDS